MGYCTVYTLKTKEKKDGKWEYSEPSVQEDFAETFSKAYNPDPEAIWEEAQKWYEAQEDLIDFSKSHPEILFELFGFGDDSDDIWVLYVLNEESFRSEGRVVFDPCPF
jgi:hypothetical protein